MRADVILHPVMRESDASGLKAKKIHEQTSMVIRYLNTDLVLVAADNLTMLAARLPARAVFMQFRA